jgi:hypothetical protein
LRRLLLQQEEAHHGFGRRGLARAIAAGETSTEVLAARGREYLILAEAMVRMLGELFDSIDEDPDAWLADAWARLPEWLGADAIDSHPASFRQSVIPAEAGIQSPAWAPAFAEATGLDPGVRRARRGTGDGRCSSSF